MDVKRCEGCKMINPAFCESCRRCGRSLAGLEVRTRADRPLPPITDDASDADATLDRYGLTRGERVALGLFPPVWLFLTATWNATLVQKVVIFLVAYGIFAACGLLIGRMRLRRGKAVR